MDICNLRKMENIMLSGPDGTGKSTISKKIVAYYSKKNRKLISVWLRFHHYFAKVVNLIGRLTGKSFKESYTWGKVGYHEYQGYFGYLYIFAIYFDHILFRIFVRPFVLKKRLDSNYIIDRYIIDIAADLIVDTKKIDLVLKLFRRFINKELKFAKAYILECPETIVFKRRPDILDDKKYKDKVNAYKLLAKEFKIEKINTHKFNPDEVVEKIIDK